MKSQWTVALILLVGFVLLAVSLNILAINEAAFTTGLASNTTARIPNCELLNGRGCVTWPYYVVGLGVPGLLMTMAGVIGLIETAFPRREL